MTVRVSSVSVETIDEASERFVEQIVTEMRRAVRVVTGDLGEVTVAAVEPASIGPDDLGAMRASWRRSVDDRLLATLTSSLLHSSTLQASAVNSAVGATLAQPLGQTLLTDLFVDTARNRLVDIGDDLWTNARESLVEGINAGESVPALAKRVRESVDVTTPRATTIARTEVVGAYNRGSIETMRAVGLVTVKVWMSTPDGRTRESHRDADGQQVGLDETFVVGGADLDHPGDPWGPPEEVVNCRCTMGYEVDESGVDILQEDEDALIAAARDHDGAMIALVPTDADLDRLALEGYEERDELHLTLAYLGDADDWSDEHREAVTNALSTYDWGVSQVDGVAFGVNNWNPASDTPSWVLAIGAPHAEPDELSNAHATVWDQLARLRGEFSDLPETPAQHKPWVPHLCLAYGDDPSIRDSMLERLGPVAFDRVRVSFAGNAVDFPLDGTISASALEATVSWYIERGHPDCTDDKPWAVVEVATGNAVGTDATREAALDRIRALTVPPAAQVLSTVDSVETTVDSRAFQEEDCPPGNHRMPDGSCMPDEDMDSSGIVEFTGVAVVEGEPTGDGRQFAPGSLDWPDLETVVVPLQWQKETSHGGVNDVTVSVGRLTHLQREGSRIVVGGTIDGGSEDGAEVIRRLRVKTLGGVSIVADDPEQAEVEYVFPEGCPNLDDATPEELDDVEMKCFFPNLMIFHSGRIRALTIVDTPAFVEASIELVETETASAGPIFGAVATHETATSDDPWDADVNVGRLDSSMSVDTAREMFAWIDSDAIDDGQVAKSSCKFAHHEVNEDGTVGAANLTACAAVIGALHGSRGAAPDILSSDRQGVYDHVAKHLRDADMEPPPLEEIDKLAAALVAASHVVVIPDVPPAEWFHEPAELPPFGAITVTDEGRVYGLLAPRDVSHRSYPDRRVTVPTGNVDYSRWMNRERIVQNGRLRTGVITMDCGHASTAPWVDAVAGRDHYENSCSPVATVRIGENSKGVWVAGALLPDVTAAQVQRMLVCQLSGDWRPHREKSGQREFVAALLVPVPGFPVGAHASLRLDETQLVASAVPVSLEIVGDVSDVEPPSDVDDAPVSPAPAPPPAETIPTWEEVQRRRELRAQFDRIAEELGIPV